MTIFQIRELLGLCLVINLVLMTISFLLLTLARGWVYKMHSKWFSISEPQFNTIAYSSLGVYKILVFMFNIVPWIAVCIVTG
jgi:hypothetical protein